MISLLCSISLLNDVVPTMLTQSHEELLLVLWAKQLHSERNSLDVTIMGDNRNLPTAKYIHGEYGAGQWTCAAGMIQKITSIW